MGSPESDVARSTRTVVGQGELAIRKLRPFRLRTPDGVQLLSKPFVRVGARPGCDLVLADESISRLHFEIVADDDGYRLRDLGSKNGTFVDGYRVRDVYLRPRSLIRAGNVEIRFELGGDEVDVPASAATRFGPLIGKSVVMRELFATLERAARAEVTILVEGESGTGKELVARAVHATSSRADGPFEIVDCGAIPVNLLESELFGHERGAFTGADEQRIGILEAASGGTLFLDEIGELPIDLQPRLLRVLETGEIRRVGGTKHIEIDLRVIAATNRDLAAEVNRKAFRDDLYYRLAVVHVRMPPLRDRLEDLPLLVEHLVRRALASDVARADRLLGAITPEMWGRLAVHPWRGNVRELRNALERAIALAELDASASFDPAAAPPARMTASAALEGWEIDLSRSHADLKAAWIHRFDQAYVQGQLAKHGGNITHAARASGLERTHFKRILNRTR